MPDPYERVANSFIDASEEVKSLFKIPYPEIMTEFTEYYMKSKEQPPIADFAYPTDFAMSPVSAMVTAPPPPIPQPKFPRGVDWHRKHTLLHATKPEGQTYRTEGGLRVEEWEAMNPEEQKSLYEPGQRVETSVIFRDGKPTKEKRYFIEGEPTGVDISAIAREAVEAPVLGIPGVPYIELSPADLASIGLVAAAGVTGYQGAKEIFKRGYQRLNTVSFQNAADRWERTTGGKIPQDTRKELIDYANQNVKPSWMIRANIKELFKTEEGKVLRFTPKGKKLADDFNYSIVEKVMPQLTKFTATQTGVPGQTIPSSQIISAIEGAIPATARVAPTMELGGVPIQPTKTTPIMADLQEFQEVIDIASKPDVYRSISNLPVIRNIMDVLGPAATADSPAKWSVVGRGMLRHEGYQKTQGVMSLLNRLGSQDKVFGKLDDKGLIQEGKLKGLNLNTVRTYPQKYLGKLNLEQKRWIEQASKIERAKLDFLRRNEIEINELSFEEGGEYAGRRVFAKLRIVEGEPELLDATYVGAGPGRPGAKLSAEKHRIFDTAEEAIELGYRYLPEDEALYLNVLGAYHRVADKMMADWLISKVPWRTTGAPEELKLAAFQSKQKLNRARQLQAALNRALRGERVPESTIKSIGNSYPEQAQKLRDLIPLIQAGKPTARDVKSFDAEIKSLIADAKYDNAEAISARARARETAMRTSFEEAQIPSPAFTGKIFTGPEAKETARVIRESLNPDFGKALDAVNKVNAIGRYFVLAGDISPMTIQLLFLAGGNPKAYAKAGAGLIRAIFDTKFHDNYLAKHNETIQNSQNLILTKAGATEFTEAMARGGLLRKGPLKLGGKVLEPFQRGFETALDVAGIEMREALQHYCTTPERTAQVEQFINEFRGLTSSSRIGVSARQRQYETLLLLAPRYNRAIASLLFDVSRGTLRGHLARMALAKGIAAVVAVGVALSYAMGESDEEVVDHLNPTSPAFMTWQIGGQKVGPGSKLRSVMKLFGESAENPENLLSLSMENPGLRFVRGNFAPVVSTGVDLLVGRNYIGDPTRDGLLSFSETVFAENLLPVWAQSVILEGGDLGELAIRGGVEFSGMRGYPDPWGKLENMRNDASRSQYNKPYDNLNRLQQKRINENKDIKELQKQTEAESARRATGFRGEVDAFFAEGDRVEAYRTEKLWDIHNQLISGQIEEGEANTAYWLLGKEISGMYESRDRDPAYDKVREYLEEKEAEKEAPSYPGDKAYYEYQKVYELAEENGWDSEEISNRINAIWVKYPGSEEYVRQIQEVGKDWPPSYLVYRRNRGKDKGKMVGQVDIWSLARPQMRSETLSALNTIWYGGGSIEQMSPQSRANLNTIYNQSNTGNLGFNPWVKQNLRQSFESSLK